MRSLTVLFILLAIGVVARAQNPAEGDALPLMPMPASVHLGSGRFMIGPSFAIVIHGCAEPRLQRAATRVLNTLYRQTGISFIPPAPPSPAAFVINCTGPSAEVQALGEEESYRLEVSLDSVRLDAPNPLGVLRGMQTFLQLVEKVPAGYGVPGVVIEDRPRFPWRGLLIDVARRFMPVEVIKRNLDGMEAVKLNVLHWHLSDDQGFRVQSQKFPRLTEMGSDGMFYTAADIHDVLEYARDRGIRVVPEFDIPGHTTAWFVGYPDLSSGPGPFSIERHWGVFNPAMDPTRETTYDFLDPLIGEMTALFPDQYFHIGGDEVNGKQWEGNPQIQEFMRLHDLKKSHDLQAFFNKRVQELVKKHGKIMAGWDEVLHPDLPREIVVQSWRGQESLARAARLGYKGILSYGYYLDLMQPASYHYSIDPLDPDVAAGMTAEDKQRIIGGEACMWSEFVSPENIDGRIWPRAAAVAERLWSPQNIRDTRSMYRRMEAVSRGLDWHGITHHSAYHAMLQRLAGGPDTTSLQVLADVLEPVKLYARNHGNKYVSSIPLTRLVDTVRPESDRGRIFAALVDAYLHSRNRKAGTPEARSVESWLTTWKDNDPQLQPVLRNSGPLKEIIPVSQDLAAVASAGLAAIFYLEAGGKAPRAWHDQQLVMLKEVRKPNAEMLDMVVPPVQLLVESTIPED